MLHRIALPLVVLLGLLVGCQRSPSAPPAAAKPTARRPPPPPGPLPTRAEVENPHQAEADRSTAYTKEHPWGEHTGTARLRGVLTWDGNGPPAPAYRPALELKGLQDTPSAGLFYRVQTDEQGQFVFDRIKSGQFQLTDHVSPEPHWRLKIELGEREEKVLDLSPGNSLKVRDDFRKAGN